MDKAIELLKEVDSKVDAIGLGGIDLYLYANGRRYQIKDATKLAGAVKNTPLVDGSGLKNTLERRTIEYLQTQAGLKLAGKTVLMVSAVDRFGMAEALSEAQCKMIFGDLIFGLNIPIPLHSFTVFNALARVILPVVVRMPFEMLYPTGKKQEESSKSKNNRYYKQSDIVAGDYLFIRKFMPEDMKGKWILTNTVTANDVEDLRERGIEYLVTTTPEFAGRSFGTNVLEALFVAILDKPVNKISPNDYLSLIEQLNIKPRVQKLN